MPPDCETSYRSGQSPAAPAAGNGLDGQPSIHGDEPLEGSATSQFDRRLHNARTEVLGGADRRKDEFLATVCHELRGPIGAIRNAVKVLRCQNDFKVAVQHHMHELIERQAQQMAFLVSGLLDITRIVRGQLALQRERVDLRAVLGNAVETLEWDLKGRSHQLSLTLPESSVWLVADGARLEQVFVNLLGNASKYTQIGGELALSLHVSGGSAIVRVRDSGIGISPDALPHIFDLFMQAEAAVPRSGSGLGIGLALVRAILESHGGNVTALSAGLGQGSEFIVCLPLEP
ncbi:MAG TPA: HAMP domain-containing sensor histidine kinase [Steroidobacteraceae bacterium]|jgi:two-component system CheB/CheR fusion protein|nr:HAMP domain-containing sensor histidine kinase [Steroidobacteraceae bacterium]